MACVPSETDRPSVTASGGALQLLALAGAPRRTEAPRRDERVRRRRRLLAVPEAAFVEFRCLDVGGGAFGRGQCLAHSHPEIPRLLVARHELPDAVVDVRLSL